MSKEKHLRSLSVSTLVIPPIADVWEECLAGRSDCLENSRLWIWIENNHKECWQRNVCHSEIIIVDAITPHQRLICTMWRGIGDVIQEQDMVKCTCSTQVYYFTVSNTHPSSYCSQNKWVCMLLETPKDSFTIILFKKGHIIERS